MRFYSFNDIRMTWVWSICSHLPHDLCSHSYGCMRKHEKAFENVVCVKKAKSARCLNDYEIRGQKRKASDVKSLCSQWETVLAYKKFPSNSQNWNKWAANSYRLLQFIKNCLFVSAKSSVQLKRNKGLKNKLEQNSKKKAKVKEQNWHNKLTLPISICADSYFCIFLFDWGSWKTFPLCIHKLNLGSSKSLCG